jgi:hypothetical protein
VYVVLVCAFLIFKCFLYLLKLCLDDFAACRAIYYSYAIEPMKKEPAYHRQWNT